MSIAALIDLYEPHELITVDEVCENENLVSIFEMQEISDDYNCSQLFILVDVNQNGYIGIWETIVGSTVLILDEAVHVSEKVQQIDCSMCMSDPSLYKM